jgi:hypothetical protein
MVETTRLQEIVYNSAGGSYLEIGRQQMMEWFTEQNAADTSALSSDPTTI